MAEFFLELFTEEIPANLQIHARENLILNIKSFLDKEKIPYKGKSKSYSTPNRLVIYFENIDSSIIKEAQEVRGPSVDAPKKALDGFTRSNKINLKDIYKKETEKGVFYFFKTSSSKLRTLDLLEENIPSIFLQLFSQKELRMLLLMLGIF